MKYDYRVKKVEETLEREKPYAKYTGNDGYKYYVRFVQDRNQFKLTCKKSSDPIGDYFTLDSLPDELKESGDLVEQLKMIWFHFNGREF